MRGKFTAVDSGVYDYLLAHQAPEHCDLRALRRQTQGLPNAYMQISPEQGHLLGLLVRLIGARRCLEIGTFTGYSALAMALVLPTDGARRLRHQRALDGYRKGALAARRRSRKN